MSHTLWNSFSSEEFRLCKTSKKSAIHKNPEFKNPFTNKRTYVSSFIPSRGPTRDSQSMLPFPSPFLFLSLSQKKRSIKINLKNILKEKHKKISQKRTQPINICVPLFSVHTANFQKNLNVCALKSKIIQLNINNLKYWIY